MLTKQNMQVSRAALAPGLFAIRIRRLTPLGLHDLLLWLAGRENAFANKCGIGMIEECSEK